VTFTACILPEAEVVMYPVRWRETPFTTDVSRLPSDAILRAAGVKVNV